MCNDTSHQKEFQKLRDAQADTRADIKIVKSNIETLAGKIDDFIKTQTPINDSIRNSDHEHRLRAVENKQKKGDKLISAVITFTILEVTGAILLFIMKGGLML